MSSINITLGWDTLVICLHSHSNRLLTINFPGNTKRCIQNIFIACCRIYNTCSEQFDEEERVDVLRYRKTGDIRNLWCKHTSNHYNEVE